MMAEAQMFWDSIVGKIKSLIRLETANTFRAERYEVTTAPNGTVIGVTKALGTKEIFLPYSQEVSSAVPGQPVLVVWWGSMSNAKVYYYANGYNGGGGASSILNQVYPIGSVYMSVNNVSPAVFLGGTWEQIKDTFLLAAGDTYAAGATGGEASHAITQQELPNVTYPVKFRDGRDQSWGTSNAGTGGAIQLTGVFGSSDYYVGPLGSGQAHNNMPPYLTVYMWQRTA